MLKPNVASPFLISVAVLFAVNWLAPDVSEADKVRNTARTNVNHNVNVNRNRNVNVNRDVNVHRDVDIDVDHHYHGHYGYGYDHPYAAAAGVAAAATAASVVTRAVVGSVVYSLPPACSAVVVNGLTYQNCGGTWYQPRYAGTQVNYVVVNPPR
jgi:hypothetical protein